jgi:hypothetical protein
MTDIFVSYSRKDKEFVTRLLGALSAKSRDVWIDWDDIPLTANWWEAIKAGIEGANYFTFIMSPDSLKSEVCLNELNHAFSYNKRIIPIIWRPVNDLPHESIPNFIVELNWIHFEDGDAFEVSLKQLLQAIETDIEYIHEHTRLLVRAIEWQKRGLHADFLLQGIPLIEAERWLAKGDKNQPEPSPLHIEYIRAGRTASETMLKRTKRTIKKLPSMLGLGKRKVFISYRRADSQYHTDRIYDRLQRHFRTEDIFMDIASIDLGVNFAEVIRRSLSECIAAIVVIGPQWVNITDKATGARRLDEANDLVRLEVEIALNNPGIRVMPLLVGGATMPQVHELPSSLQKLMQRNSTVIRHGRDFHNDMDDVVKQLRKARNIQ